MPTDPMKLEMLSPQEFYGEVISYGSFDEHGDRLARETQVIYVDIPLSCGLPKGGSLIVVNGIDRIVTANNIGWRKGRRAGTRVGIEFHDA